MKRRTAGAIAAIVGIGALAVVDAAAQDMMMKRSQPGMGERSMERRDNDALRNLGVGVGVGVIRELSTPRSDAGSGSSGPAAPARRSTKSPSKKAKQTAKADPGSQLRFVGKPDDVVHNPQQRDGKLGDLRDHRQVVISHDGSLFSRHYYYVREGKQITWYWYDLPLTDAAVLASLTEVPVCRNNDDNCDGAPLLRVDNGQRDRRSARSHPDRSDRVA